MDSNNDIFQIDEASDLPIWIQLRNRMAYLIKTGHFKPNEQLPSVRSVAADAGINYNTVAKAYRDLESSKLIISVRGRGMYVRENATDSKATPEMDAVDAMLIDCLRRYHAMGMTLDDIDEHMHRILEDMKGNSQAYMEERMRYRGPQKA